MSTDVKTGESVPSTDEKVTNDTSSEQNTEVEGLRQALEAERTKRQAAEQRALLVEQFSQQNQKEVQSDDDYEYYPDDYVDVKTVKKIVQEAVQTTNTSEDIFKMQVELAKNKYSDYQEVVKNWESKVDDKTYQAVMASGNPAELAYRLGRADDAYQKKLIDKATEEYAEKMRANSEKPSTIGGVSGKSPDLEVKDYENMSDEEFEKELLKVKTLPRMRRSF